MIFGRLPADPAKPKLRLLRAAKAPVSAPDRADWLGDSIDWGMLGNDAVGDCTAAGAGHADQAISFYGKGVADEITTDEALSMYSAISGYNGDPSTDVGATLQDALDYWRQNGIAGHKIVAHAQLDYTDLDLVRTCIALFGGVYTGMWFPSSAMDQFDNGQKWTVKRSRIEGGHCVWIGAYDPSSFTCVTWGKRQQMDINFFRTYFDEVWVPIDQDWVSSGLSPASLDVATLNADFSALTGQPGPFTGVTPDPAPNPADVALMAAQDAWRAARGYA